MKTSFSLAVIAGCLFFYGGPTAAQVPPQAAPDAALAAGPCDKPNLTAEQRADKSDLVFEGTIIDVQCDCRTGSSGTSYDASMIPCKLDISVGEVTKGLPDGGRITLAGNAGDPGLDWGMDKQLCTGFINKYTKEMLNKVATYYVIKTKDGYKETPASGCTP